MDYYEKVESFLAASTRRLSGTSEPITPPTTMEVPRGSQKYGEILLTRDHRTIYVCSTCGGDGGGDRFLSCEIRMFWDHVHRHHCTDDGHSGGKSSPRTSTTADETLAKKSTSSDETLTKKFTSIDETLVKKSTSSDESLAKKFKLENVIIIDDDDSEEEAEGQEKSKMKDPVPEDLSKNREEKNLADRISIDVLNGQEPRFSAESNSEEIFMNSQPPIVMECKVEKELTPTQSAPRWNEIRTPTVDDEIINLVEDDDEVHDGDDDDRTEEYYEEDDDIERMLAQMHSEEPVDLNEILKKEIKREVAKCCENLDESSAALKEEQLFQILKEQDYIPQYDETILLSDDDEEEEVEERSEVASTELQTPPPPITATPSTGQSQGYVGYISICHLCEKSFTSTSALVEHSKTHINDRLEHDLAPLQCSFCPRRFRLPAKLKQHEVAHFRMGQMRNSKLRPFKCIACGVRTTTEKAMFTHISRFHGDGQDAATGHCPICRKLLLKTSLNSHIQRLHPMAFISQIRSRIQEELTSSKLRGSSLTNEQTSTNVSDYVSYGTLLFNQDAGSDQYR